MGSTLEAQQKKAPKPKTQTKKKEIVVTPGKPYYSSESLRKGFEQRLPSADMSAQLRQTSPLGRMSPRAAVLDVSAKAMDLFRGHEGQVGSRHAENVAEYMNKNDGGMAYKTRRF